MKSMHCSKISAVPGKASAAKSPNWPSNRPTHEHKQPHKIVRWQQPLAIPTNRNAKAKIMDGAEVISLYESVADLTDQMLAAARQEDWDLLSRLESDCAHVVNVLKQNEASVRLSDDRRDRKIAILKKILEDDRDIRNLTDPGLQKLSALIKNTSTERKLANAYGTNPRG